MQPQQRVPSMNPPTTIATIINAIGIDESTSTKYASQLASEGIQHPSDLARLTAKVLEQAGITQRIHVRLLLNEAIKTHEDVAAAEEEDASNNARKVPPILMSLMFAKSQRITKAKSPVKQVCFALDAQEIVYVLDDGFVTYMDLVTWKEEGTGVNCSFFPVDETTGYVAVVTAIGRKAAVTVHEVFKKGLRPNEKLLWRKDDFSPMQCIIFLSQLELLCGCCNGDCVLIDIDLNRHQRITGIHTDAINCLVLNTSRHTVASASDDKTCKVFEPISGYVLYTFDGHYGPCTSLVWVSESMLASCGLDMMVLVWDICDEVEVGRADIGDYGWTMSLSYDGSVLAVGTESGTVALWNMALPDLQEVDSVGVLYNGRVHSVCFHPTLPILTTGSHDGFIRIYEWFATRDKN